MNESPRTDAFDCVVVGGGIHGAGIARDAAMRGLRVALFERDDFASGTSSASSKLVHGGLRYLEQFRIGLVRESLRERATLLRIAPHLVRPLPILAPVYRGIGRGRTWMGAGLFLYDLLATGASLGRHQWLAPNAALAHEPSLDPDGLQGAFLFHDAQMDDARLCLENVLDARNRGAHVRNGAEVLGLVIENGQVRGVRVREADNRQVSEVHAPVVINAAGPWIGEINAQQSLTARRPPRLARGSHVVVPALTRGNGLLLSARSDGRVLFVLPYKGASLIGTTEVEHRGDAGGIEASEEEIGYLLSEASHCMHGVQLRREDVLFAFAGLRAMPADDGTPIHKVNREARVREEAPGLISVLGGKCTTYRATAEHVVDLVARRSARPVSGCATSSTPLPGGDVPPMNDYFRVAEELLTHRYDQLELGVLRYLVGTYGSRHLEVLRILDAHPESAARIEPDLPFTFAEVRHAVQNEMARSLDDVLRRRCYRTYLGRMSEASRSRWQEAFDRAVGATRAPV